MKRGNLQARDIPDAPILAFLADLPPYENGQRRTWATWYRESNAAVQHAMPAGTPDKLALAKMRSMIRRGLIQGCPCGCRGDFRLPD